MESIIKNFYKGQINRLEFLNILFSKYEVAKSETEIYFSDLFSGNVQLKNKIKDSYEIESLDGCDGSYTYKGFESVNEYCFGEETISRIGVESSGLNLDELGHFFIYSDEYRNEYSEKHERKVIVIMPRSLRKDSIELKNGYEKICDILSDIIK